MRDDRSRQQNQISGGADYSDAYYTPANLRSGECSYNPARGYIRRPSGAGDSRGSSAGGFAAAFLICMILATVLGVVGTQVVLRHRQDQTQSQSESKSEELTALYAELELLSQSDDSEEPSLLTLNSCASLPVLSAEEIYSRACSSIVGITIPGHAQNIFGQTGRSTVTGSGIILRNDGYILTNYHVIEPAYEDGSPVFVITYDGQSNSAQVVGVETESDLAVLKIERNDLVPAVLGDSDEMRVGQSIYVIGNPLGELTYTMTSGIVSALDRRITTDENITVNMFQIDAAVNNGNSGGPVYNAFGQVIGVVTAKYSENGMEGLGFAIPVADAADIARELMTYGYVSGKAYLGLTMTTVSESVAKYYDMVQGVYVFSVEEGSCSELAGLTKGDIITAIDGVTVTTNKELVTAVKNYRAGDCAVLTVYRQGSYEDIPVIFDEELPAEAMTDEELVMSTSGEMGLPDFGSLPSAEASGEASAEAAE